MLAVIRIDVRTGDRPIFVDPPGGGRIADFYVRTANSTQKLLTDDLVPYEKSRWK